MSMLARRAVLRAVPRARNFAATAGKTSYREQQEATIAHAAGTSFILPSRIRSGE